ncbi:hypothetical protein K1719_009667 [Acacia pycnantha]|nr:hypothetical protein K1719_009667 [Acacia pycnantha]
MSKFFGRARGAKGIFSNSQFHDHGGDGDIREGGVAALQNLTDTHMVNPMTIPGISFLYLMKQIFQNQPEKYETFQAIMIDFKAQRIHIAEVREKVKELFEGHDDLISRFNAFLPKGYEISPDDEDEAPPKKKVVNYEEALDFVYKIKEQFQDDDHVYLSFMDILNMYRSNVKDIAEVYKEVSSLFGNHPDLLEEFTRFLPDDSATTIQHTPYGEDLAQCIHASKLDGGKAMIKKHKKQVEEISDRRVLDRNEGKHELLENRAFCQARNFFSKVAEKLDSSGLQQLLSDFERCKRGKIKRQNLNDLVATSIGEFPDIMDEYNKFWGEGENIDGFLANVIKSFDGDDQLLRSSKLEDRERDQAENTGQLQRSPKLEARDRNQKREVLVSKESKELLECLVGFEEEGPPTCHGLESDKESKEKRDEKYMRISIHKLDLSDCERCNASYRRLPEDYPIPIPSLRSELATEVLNDHWVSVTSGSEEEAFKRLRWNRYEKTLIECEDDQFELDLLINRAESTAEHANEFYNSITGKEINTENPIRIEEYLSVIDLRHIEKLYDDHGLEVIEALRKNPVVALPVIMMRLEQKMTEWEERRSEFNKVWAQVYAKNHEKSRDHRSLSFKQEDSKNLKPKALMAEIKEIKEKLPNQEWLQATADVYKLSPIPHMQFSYSDAEIHEDLYELVCYASEEIVGSRCLLDKMLGIWTTFLEPMLGVHSRSDKLAATENRRDGSENVDCNAKVSVAKSQSGNVSRVEHCDMATPDSLANRVLIQSNNQEEKEEGEISDYDDDTFEGGEDVSGREYSQEKHEGKGDKEHDDIDDKAKVERMCDAQSATDGSLLESSFLSAKPVSKYIPPVLLEERRESRVIYGNDDFYVLFRLHHILYERILSAKTNSMKPEVKRRVANNANSSDPYSRFMNSLCNFIGGSVGEEKFEGECLAIFGPQSYMLFTLDKLIQKLVKQLQVVANFEVNDKILRLFEYENSQKPERLAHLAYLGNARVILPDDNIYRLEYSSGPCKLFIWLTDRTNEMPTAINPNYADYLYNDLLSVFPLKEEPKGIMLQRHKRKRGASDEFPDMEGVIVINQLEHVMDCNSSKCKVKYDPYKEDLLYRRRKKQKTWSKHNKAREERYHRYGSYFIRPIWGSKPLRNGVDHGKSGYE